MVKSAEFSICTAFREYANGHKPEPHEIDSEITQRKGGKFALLTFDGCPSLFYTYNVKLIIHYPVRKEGY